MALSYSSHMTYKLVAHHRTGGDFKGSNESEVKSLHAFNKI